MGSSLAALAVSGTDWGLWSRQQTYNLMGWPHIEFSDIEGFLSGVLFHTGVWKQKKPVHKPAGAAPPPPPEPIRTLSMLTILTHGTFDGPVMGSGHGDVLTRARILGRRKNLASLCKCFDRGAEVVFGGCLIGTNPWLLADLSELWPGIKVTAYTDLQKLGSPQYSGDKITLLGRTLVSGADTAVGKQYQARPHDPVRKADETMG